MSEELKNKNSSNTMPKAGAPIKQGVPSRPTMPALNRPPVKPMARPSAKSVTNKKPQKPIASKSGPIADKPLTKPKASAKAINSKDIKASDNKEEKKNKRKKFLLLLLFLLLFFVGIGVAIFFIANIQTEELNFTVQVKSDVETTIVDPNDHTVSNIVFMPGDSINASMLVQVKNQHIVISHEKVFLRFKIDIEVDNNAYSGLFEPELNESEAGEKWTRGDDGYFYYNYFVYGTEPKFTVFNYLDFVGNRVNNVLNGKTGKIVFVVEILEGNFSAISQHWYTAPTKWRRIVN